MGRSVVGWGSLLSINIIHKYWVVADVLSNRGLKN